VLDGHGMQQQQPQEQDQEQQYEESENQPEGPQSRKCCLRLWNRHVLRARGRLGDWTRKLATESKTIVEELLEVTVKLNEG